MILERRAQTAVWGLLAFMVFIAIGSGLVDIYRLYAARNWGYSVAQEAALVSTSKGRDWDAITSGGQIRLVESVARDEAVRLVQAEMMERGIKNFTLDVRVLPDTNGGSISGYPPRPVRLGQSLGAWNSDEPAVGIYLSFPVEYVLLDRIGVVEKSVFVFASAGVGQ